MLCRSQLVLRRRTRKFLLNEAENHLATLHVSEGENLGAKGAEPVVNDMVSVLSRTGDLEHLYLGQLEAEEFSPDVMIEAHTANGVRSFGNHGCLPCPRQWILESDRSRSVVCRRTGIRLSAPGIRALLLQAMDCGSQPSLQRLFNFQLRPVCVERVEGLPGGVERNMPTGDFFGLPLVRNELHQQALAARCAIFTGIVIQANG
jgi:hypothetical protein